MIAGIRAKNTEISGEAQNFRDIFLDFFLLWV
jgi:hypothetical protein